MFVMRPMNRRAINQPARAKSTAAVMIYAVRMMRTAESESPEPLFPQAKSIPEAPQLAGQLCVDTITPPVMPDLAFIRFVGTRHARHRRNRFLITGMETDRHGRTDRRTKRARLAGFGDT